MTLKARPILFQPEMARALWEGRKTQTRRIVKPGRYDLTGYETNGRLVDYLGNGRSLGLAYQKAGYSDLVLPCPYGCPDDLLWVREAAWICPPGWTDTPANPMGPYRQEVAYKANDRCGGTAEAARDYKLKLRPSIHMPRWASRMTLELTEVRVERLQDISEEDAEAEGTAHCDICGDVGWINSGPDGGWQCTAPHCGDPYIDCFQRVWIEINGPDSWKANPWVWVLVFTVHKQNVDALTPHSSTGG